MMVQRIFHLKSERQRTLRMLFGDCRLIYFYSLTKSAFLLSKGLLRLYDKHNNTWTVKNIWRFHIFIFIHSYIHTFIHSYSYIHDNNTWLLMDMVFLFLCSTRHLTRLLRSLVNYRVKHSKRNSISTRAHVLFSICYLSNQIKAFY